ncbi:MAG: hypothetical protein ACLUD0_11700 [Eubacterium ramulus]
MRAGGIAVLITAKGHWMKGKYTFIPETCWQKGGTDWSSAAFP